MHSTFDRSIVTLQPLDFIALHCLRFPINGFVQFTASALADLWALAFFNIGRNAVGWGNVYSSKIISGKVMSLRLAF